MTIPAYEFAIWSGNTVTNTGSLPLWSGKGAVPAIGDVVPVGRDLTITVEGYVIDARWLMLLGVRSDGMRGNLAGAEIAWHRMPAKKARAWFTTVWCPANDFTPVWEDQL